MLKKILCKTIQFVVREKNLGEREMIKKEVLNISILTVIAGLLSNCGGGVMANMVKVRDHGKKIAFVCKIDMNQPKIAREISGVGSYAKYVNAAYGEYSENEKRVYDQWGKNQCAKVLNVLKSDLKLVQIETVELEKMPVTQISNIAGTFPVADIGKANYDYAWIVNIYALKRAEEYDPNFVTISTRVSVSYVGQDWIDRDANKVKLLFYPISAAYIENRSPENPLFSHITIKDFPELNDITLEKASESVDKTIIDFKKEISDINSKKN